MRVEVLYFAAVAELAANERETLILPDDVTTVRAFVAHLEATHESLRGRLASVRVARNEEFARPSDALADGDVLALIPPVAGG